MKSKFIVSALGTSGRFGNQILQYCFAKGLARYYDAELQVPADWIGRLIFNIPEKPIDPELLIHKPPQTGIDYIPNEKEVQTIKVIDLFGYWQNQNSIDFYSRLDMLEWLKFQNWVTKMFPENDNEMPTMVVHKRRGDYPKQPHCYCSITDESFAKAINIAEQSIPKPYILEEITEENPGRNELCEQMNLGFLPDFMKMVNANYIIRSNSTFSLVAAWLGANKVLSPIVNDKIGWQDVDWVWSNHPRCADSRYHSSSKLTDLHLRDK